MTAITLTLDLFPISTYPEDDSGYSCPECLQGLSLHQPDIQCPGRLLATCRRCGAWFSVSLAAGLMIRLPDDTLPDA